MSLGAVLTTANPLNTPAEIAKQVADATPAVAFAPRVAGGRFGEREREFGGVAVASGAGEKGRRFGRGGGEREREKRKEEGGVCIGKREREKQKEEGLALGKGIKRFGIRFGPRASRLGIPEA